MVGFSNCRSIGEAAQSTASSNFRNTISSMKRLVGLSFNDPRAQKEMKFCLFTCVPIEHAGRADSIGVKVDYNSEETIVPVEAVAGMVVKHMGTIVAEKNAQTNKMQGDVNDVHSSHYPKDFVITVPGYYTDAQKRALLIGCKTVGIDTIQRLMHENTAVALAYGIFKDIRNEFTKDKPTNVMFIDLGATSYSCTVVSYEPGKLDVKNSQYDPDLGGREFDHLIAEWLAEKFEEKFKGKLSAKPMDKPKVLLKLLAAAEKAKKTLSPAGVREARVNLECLMDDFDFNVVLKAAEYEQMCAPLLARLAAPVERALNETGLKASDISSIEVTGGGSRVGCVKRTLGKVLGLKEKLTNYGLSTTLNADEAVARGAALQSAILSPRFKVKAYEITEFQPYPVKIAWDGEACSGQQEGVEVEGDTESKAMPTNSVVMFPRGSNYNSVRRVTLRRAGEFQVTASYDDSSSQFQYPEGVSKEIATFKIKAPEGTENKVRVNVKQDIHGRITLSSTQMVEESLEVVEKPVEEKKDKPAEEKEGEPKESEPKESEAKEKKEESKEKEDDVKPPEKKKKIKKTNLEFCENYPSEWTKAEIDKANEAEVAMSNTDRLVNETADKRNELESYIYDMRDKINSEKNLAPYASDEEKKTFSSLLESGENWLYEDGFDATKSVYAAKLEELTNLGNPIAIRQVEAVGRPNSLAVLKRTIEKYNNWLNTCSHQEEYSHITPEEIKTCHEKSDEISSWMYEMLDKQGSKSITDDPVLTVSEITIKTKELTILINPIMHKPKPKPKKEEKKVEEKTEEKKEGDEKAADEKTVDMEEKPTDSQTEAEPMQTDEVEKDASQPMDTD